MKKGLSIALIILIFVSCFTACKTSGKQHTNGNNDYYSDYISDYADQEDDSDSEKVRYISDRDVDYYDAEKKHTVFFGLKNDSMDYISSSGTAEIIIYDNDNKKYFLNL